MCPLRMYLIDIEKEDRALDLTGVVVGLLSSFYLVPRLTSAGLSLCFLHAADVGAVTGVDRDELTLVDEEGHTHLGARLYGSGLEGVGGGIALESGLGVGHTEIDVCG